MADFRARLTTGGAQVTWTKYGLPFYLLTDTERKGAATGRYSVEQTRYTPPSPKRYLRGVPIPVGAKPDPGDDGYITVIDDRPASPTYGCMYDIFEASPLGPSGNVWAASTVNRNWADDGNYTPGEGSGPRGSSFAPVAGVLRPEEIATGIHHALVFAYGHNKTTPVLPSYHSDGGNTDSLALEEGARLRLRMTTDLSGLSPGWQSIGNALKTYGAFNVDNGGTNPAFAFSALNNTISTLTWGYGIAWPWAGSDTYPTVPSVIWQNLELVQRVPQAEVQETPPVAHPCGDYSDTPF